MSNRKVLKFFFLYRKFSDKFYKLPTNRPLNRWLWLSSFVLNFKNFISRFDFQNVYVKPNWPNFSKFWTQKNANNKYFRKNFCIYKKRILSQKLVHIQKTNTKTKNFCDTPLLIYGTRCGIIFRFNHNFAESLVLKIPQPVYRSVFEIIKIPRNGCQDIIPNAKITNAIILNVTYNGSPN